MSENRYKGIEAGIEFCNRSFIAIDEDEAKFIECTVKKIIGKIIAKMMKNSIAFNYLSPRLFLGGSCNDQLKIDKPDEFDIDILLTLPKCTTPVIHEINVPDGFVSLQLKTFEDLKQENFHAYREMKECVDGENYLLTSVLKNHFIGNLFMSVMNKVFPKNIISIGKRLFQIVDIQDVNPVLKLTIVGIKGYLNSRFHVSVDLASCIFIEGFGWPTNGYRQNPYLNLNNYCLVPYTPYVEEGNTLHLDRYWRPSFQMQEKRIISHRQRLKPSIRIVKRIRDQFGHKVSSYAVKTIFMQKLVEENPTLNDLTPTFWNSSSSNIMIVMLERYADCLKNRRIASFWNEDVNLIDYLSDDEMVRYVKDIERLLADIRNNPLPKTVIKYLGDSQSDA